MLVIDYNNIARAVLSEFTDEIQHSIDKNQSRQIIRHVMLNTIKSYKNKFPEYSDKVILAGDSPDCWRKDIFPHYKARRDKNKNGDGVDWNFIYETINLLREEIRTFLPWQVITVPRTEGDDIIGTIVTYAMENEKVSEGLVDETPRIMVISADKDFKYLYRYPTYRQWSAQQKAFSELKDVTATEFLNELIGRGDGGDDVPSILSQDDFFVNPECKRQKSMFKAFVEEIKKNGRDACEDDLQRERWDRNDSLINLDKIPQEHKEKIIAEYKNPVINDDKNLLFQYFNDHKLDRLTTVINDFY